VSPNPERRLGASLDTSSSRGLAPVVPAAVLQARTAVFGPLSGPCWVCLGLPPRGGEDEPQRIHTTSPAEDATPRPARRLAVKAVGRPGAVALGPHLAELEGDGLTGRGPVARSGGRPLPGGYRGSPAVRGLVLCIHN
jgi:hypothetical protein